MSEPTGCAVPDELVRVGTSIGAPVAAPVDGSLVVSAQQAVIVLHADGVLEIGAELTVTNRSEEPAVAAVGYGWVLPAVSEPPTAPAEAIAFEIDSAPVEPRECLERGSPRAQQPQVRLGRWVEVPVPAGGQAVVASSYRGRARRGSAPGSLFGYRDPFALNWPRRDWSYTRTDEYDALRERLRPFRVAFELAAAESTRVVARTEGGDQWFRSLSHEQDLATERMPGAVTWTLPGAPKPPVLELEYNPELPIGEEIALFERLASSRPTDLRARIRLIELLGVAGDPGDRLREVERLLGAWEAGASSQLLDRSADVRSAAYVALVRSAEAAGQEKAAARGREEAARFLDARGAERGLSAELNEAVSRWLNR